MDIIDDIRRRATALLRRYKRDVHIHAAVTIMPTRNGEAEMGTVEKDVEIAQFVVQLDARFAPFTAEMVETAFMGLKERCLERMRAAGLLRAGQ